jgi:hypothetical protein
MFAQAPDVKTVVASIRQALGGEQTVGAVKSLTATGRSTRVSNGSSSPAADFELAMELPGKYMKREVMAVIMGAEIARTSGFTDAGVLDAVDAPPGMFGGGGGHMTVRTVGGPSPVAPGTRMTPEQLAEEDKRKLLAAKQDFARLTLGMFATSFDSYPLQITHGGQAESPDGKADILDIKGEGGFAAKLFVDGKTHLPLLLSWMGKEPISLNSGQPMVVPGPGGAAAGGGGTTHTFVSGGGGAATGTGGQQMTTEERDKMMKDMQDRLAQAQASARTVEYRLYYGNYKKVDGVNVPFHFQRSIDGNVVEDVTLEKVKINPKIDAKKFEVKK